MDTTSKFEGLSSPITTRLWLVEHLGKSIPSIPRGPAEAVAFFVRQSGPLSRTADMPESSAGNTDRQELMSLRRPPGWISV